MVSFVKLSRYLSFVLGPISAWILILIGIDSLISLCLISNTQYRRSCLFLIAVFAFNLIYYSPVLVFTQLISDTWPVSRYSSNLTVTTSTISTNNIHKYVSYQNKEIIIFMMDSINSTLFPCIAIVCLYTMIRSMNHNSEQHTNRVRAIVLFARSYLTLSVVYVCLNLPLGVINLLYSFSILTDNFYVNIATYFYQASFCLNFYVLAFSNSFVRDELLVMVGLIKQPNELSLDEYSI